MKTLNSPFTSYTYCVDILLLLYRLYRLNFQKRERTILPACEIRKKTRRKVMSACQSVIFLPCLQDLVSIPYQEKRRTVSLIFAADIFESSSTLNLTDWPSCPSSQAPPGVRLISWSPPTKRAAISKTNGVSTARETPRLFTHEMLCGTFCIASLPVGKHPSDPSHNIQKLFTREAVSVFNYRGSLRGFHTLTFCFI